MDFKDRVAIVTGGAGALGTAVTLDLLSSGVRVAVPYKTPEEWAALRRRAAEHESRLEGAQRDLVSSSEVEQFVAEVRSRWKRIDFLVALAGGYAGGRSFETEDATWEHMFDVNFRSLLVPLRFVVPVMIEQGFGRIVTVSSGAILRGGGAGMAAYAVAKGAVRQLSEILADELKGYDIHVHCVMPGTMDTEANRRAMPQADFSKWVKPKDVARVIRFLLSDDARAVRSVVVPVLG